MIAIEKGDVLKCLRDIKTGEIYSRTRKKEEEIFKKGDFVRVYKKENDKIVFDIGIIDYKKFNDHDLVKDGKKIKTFKILKTRILKKEHYNDYLTDNYFKKVEDINSISINK